MRLTLGQRGDYAVRAVLFLARAGERRKAREIAKEMHIPPGFLPQLLGALVRARVIRSRAGRAGGYELRRDAADISVLQVIEATCGPLRSDRCVMSGRRCRPRSRCVVHSSWSQAQEAFARELAGIDFARLRDDQDPHDRRRQARGRP